MSSSCSPPPPRSPPFPYTTLFRSEIAKFPAATAGQEALDEPPALMPEDEDFYDLARDVASDTLPVVYRSEEHTSELQSRFDLVCRLLLEKKKIRGRTVGGRHTMSH